MLILIRSGRRYLRENRDSQRESPSSEQLRQVSVRERRKLLTVKTT